MTSKVKPTRVVSVTLAFLCTKCQTEYWISEAEAMTPNFIFLCGCGKENVVDHIVRARHHYKLASSRVEKKSLDNKVIKRIVKTLGGCGYNKGEAQEKVAKVMLACDNLSQEEVVKRVLHDG